MSLLLEDVFLDPQGLASINHGLGLSCYIHEEDRSGEKDIGVGGELLIEGLHVVLNDAKASLEASVTLLAGSNGEVSEKDFFHLCPGFFTAFEGCLQQSFSVSLFSWTSGNGENLLRGQGQRSGCRYYLTPDP